MGKSCTGAVRSLRKKKLRNIRNTSKQWNVVRREAIKLELLEQMKKEDREINVHSFRLIIGL